MTTPMSAADVEIVLRVFHSMTAEDVRLLETTKNNLLTRLMRSWRLRPPLRKMLLDRQKGICPLSNEVLEDDGKVVHIDHIWTMKDAVLAIENGASVGKTFQRLWDEDNLRAVKDKENYKRNRKERE